MPLHHRARLRQKENCKYCGSSNHLSMICFHRPRHPLRKESDTARRRRMHVATTWFVLNPPNRDGQWMCYLQITRACPRFLDRDQITLEHVYPRAKYPELKYIVDNIKPSCEFCNKEKGRNTVEQLALIFPNIESMIQTPEWQYWEAEMQKYIKPELH
jgi:5-methylcytosine-specific restriction endonuclease McrA